MEFTFQNEMVQTLITKIFYISLVLGTLYGLAWTTKYREEGAGLAGFVMHSLGGAITSFFTICALILVTTALIHFASTLGVAVTVAIVLAVVLLSSWSLRSREE